VRATTRPGLAAFLVVLTVLAAAAPAAARPSAVIEWRPCPDDATAQCATLRVPIDWADPYSARTGIALARRPATDPARRIGTLIVNPGGPGGSGVDFAVGADAFFSPALRARFDIVGFDPRGVSRSDPVVCSAALVAAAPDPMIASQRQYDAAVAYNRKLAADCRRRTGPVFDHVDTLSGVGDLEAVRAALGADKINFYGASYGTLLGAQYTQRYPARIRAVVLDSVMDHSAGVDDVLRTETDAAQDAFDEFVAWCGRDVTCVLHGRDVPAIWADLLARAAAGTLVDPYHPGRRMTVYSLLQVAFSSFYQPQWSTLATYLETAGPETAGPETAGPENAGPENAGPENAGPENAGPENADPENAGLEDALDSAGAAGRSAPSQVENGFAAMFCADWSLPVSGYPDLAGKLAALKIRAPQMLASPLLLSATVGCLGRPSAPANPQRDLRPVGTPTLVVGARHDPATAYAWAQHVTAQLGPAARLFTYDGWGHIAYGRSGCVTGTVDAYLITGRTPATGAHCPGVVPPSSGVGKSSSDPATGLGYR
jgi:pimeloyl-ACP methyl ester carboxylesterase